MLADHPRLIDYSVLSVYKRKIGSLNFNCNFFDSLRDSYSGFNQWLNKKSEDEAYVCFLQDELKAFLYLKKEDETENYSDITPIFHLRKDLKLELLKSA